MGKQISKGMAGEIAFAKENGISIFAVDYPHITDYYPVSHDKNSLLSVHSCLPDSNRGALESEIVVLRYDQLKPEYRTPINQLWCATHGNGCRPNAIGRSIFLTHIADGDKMTVYREDLCGIAKPEVLEQMKILYPSIQESENQMDIDEGLDR